MRQMAVEPIRIADQRIEGQGRQQEFRVEEHGRQIGPRRAFPSMTGPAHRRKWKA
jgi:hypothetical protein